MFHESLTPSRPIYSGLCIWNVQGTGTATELPTLMLRDDVYLVRKCGQPGCWDLVWVFMYKGT